MKFSKLILSTSLALSIGTGLVNTNTASATSGGWNEETGYYVNEEQGGISLSAASKPESHTANIEYGGSSSTVLLERVVGTTKWANKYHYTRARYESSIGSGVQGDSGRVWGTSTTIAKSSWLEKFWNYARTYWGSEA